VQYCLARALVDRQVVLAQFENDAYLDSRVVGVMARIETVPHPQTLPAGNARFAAEVAVTTTDGRHLLKAVDAAVGRTPENPLSTFQPEAKYRECAGRVLNPDGVERSLDLLARMETVDHVSTLGEVLSDECRFAQPGGPAALARAS
jgi:2-methylcitrate dehydratase PrpD